MTPSNTPMFVLVTWDDAITPQAYPTTTGVTATSANGCPLKSTYFISTEYTQYDKVYDHYKNGHEIAVHTATHQTGYSTTYSEWVDEVKAARTSLSRLANVPESEILGFRAPFLAYNSAMLRALKDTGFLYDSSVGEGAGSLISSSRGDKIWPYTLDHGIAQTCDQVSDCTTPSEWQNDGLFEIPMWTFDSAAGGSVGLMDYYDLQVLKDNFLARYNSKRVPFGLFMHAGLAQTQVSTINEFLAWCATHNDVYFISNRQLIEWMKNPVDINGAADFFSCGDDDVPQSCKNCPQVYNCNVGGYYFTSCSLCPSVYPDPNSWETAVCPNEENCQGAGCMCGPGTGATITCDDPTGAPEEEVMVECTGCFTGTSGMCKRASTECVAVDPGTGLCPSFSTACTAVVTPSTAATSTQTPTNSPTTSYTSTSSPTLSRTPTSTSTPTPTHSDTATPSMSGSVSPTNTPSISVTPTTSMTPSNTETPSSTSSPTATSTASSTQTSSPTQSSTSSPTSSATQSPTNTPSSTMTPTNTPTPSETPAASVSKDISFGGFGGNQVGYIEAPATADPPLGGTGGFAAVLAVGGAVVIAGCIAIAFLVNRRRSEKLNPVSKKKSFKRVPRDSLGSDDLGLDDDMDGRGSPPAPSPVPTDDDFGGSMSTAVDVLPAGTAPLSSPVPVGRGMSTKAWDVAPVIQGTLPPPVEHTKLVPVPALNPKGTEARAPAHVHPASIPSLRPGSRASPAPSYIDVELPGTPRAQSAVPPSR